MREEVIQELVDKYITLSFSVMKNGEALVRGEIGSDLTTDQLYVLRYINRAQSCTATELAEVFDVKKSAITAIINRMWAKGLIKRTRDMKDRRVVYLTLTEQGIELFCKTEERVQNLVESLINKFDFDEIQQFIETYEKLNHVLEDYKSKRLGE